MQDSSTPDPALDTPAVGPEYGGSGDSGVVSSVPEHAPAAGDVVDALQAEHDKLRGVFDEVLDLARAQDRQALRLRWGGIVREVIEHEQAELRVVLPAAEQVAGAGALADLRRDQQEVMDLLRPHDALTDEEAEPRRVVDVIDRVAAHLRTVDDVVLPLLARLPADERMRLGEDLRQVMG